MEKPDLKVVGEINPPYYKDPVKMLRNLVDEIEAGKYGDVETIVVCLQGDGYETFGGGRNSDLMACAYLLQANATRLHNLPWVGP